MNADWRLANFDIKKQSTIWVEWSNPGTKLDGTGAAMTLRDQVGQLITACGLYVELRLIQCPPICWILTS